MAVYIDRAIRVFNKCKKNQEMEIKTGKTNIVYKDILV